MPDEELKRRIQNLEIGLGVVGLLLLFLIFLLIKFTPFVDWLTAGLSYP